MLKFLRKYQTILLVVAGVLLMIAFTVQPLLQQLPSFTDPRLAEIGAERTKIGAIAFDEARRRLGRIETVAEPLLRSTIGLELDRDEPIWHWMLLTREARDGGFIGGPSDGAALFDAFMMGQVEQVIQQSRFQTVQQARAELGPDASPIDLQAAVEAREAEQRQEARLQLSSLRNQLIARFAGSGLEGARLAAANREFDLALADLAGIVRMVATSTLAPFRFGVPELHRAAHDQLDAARIDALVLDAAPIRDALPQPTDEQLQAHFLAHRELPPAVTDDNPFGISYQRPARVRAAALRLDLARIREAVELSRLDIRTHYDQNRGLFPQDFAEVRDEVERALRDQRAAAALEAADRVINNRLVAAQSRHDLARDGAFMALPDDWRQVVPSLDELADAVHAEWLSQHGPRMPRPDVLATGPAWLTAAEFRPLDNTPGYQTIRSVADTAELEAAADFGRLLRIHRALGLDTLINAEDPGSLADRPALSAAFEQNPPAADDLRLLADLLRTDAYRPLVAELTARDALSRATTNLGNQPVPFAELIPAVREARAPDAPTPPFTLQVGWPSPRVRLVDPDGNRLVLLIEDARPPSPAESVDEVAREVRRGWRRIEAFRRLADLRPELEAALGSEAALPAAAQTYATRAGATQPPAITPDVRVSRGQGARSDLGPVPAALRDPRWADALMTDIEAATSPAGDAPGTAFITDVPAADAIVVSALRERDPVTIDAFRAAVSGLMLAEFRDLREQLGDDALASPFTFPTLQQRLQLVITDRRMADEPEPVPEDAPAAG